LAPKNTQPSPPNTPLCTTSTFFKKIFASKPLTCKTIILPDEEPKYVNAFNIWLINKCLIVTVTVTELMSLYLLADRFSCNFFKNYIMDLLQDHLLSKDLLLKAEEITRIWKETKSTAKTPIRKFCVALMSFEVFRGTGLVEEVMMLHEENKGLIEEYIRWQMEMKDIRTKTTDDPRVRGRFGESGFRICTFHAHEAGDDECDSVANTYMVKKGKLDF
jgi:hypothetical protein